MRQRNRFAGDIYQYMKREPTHLLTKMGVLSSFSISTKLTEKEVNAMARSLNKKTKNDDELVALVKEKIVNDIIEASRKGKLPGILLEEIKTPVPIKDIETLNKMVVLLSSKLKSKKIDKLSLCYFINYLVGSLELTEEDFEEFHRRVSEAQENEEDE